MPNITFRKHVSAEELLVFYKQYQELYQKMREYSYYLDRYKHVVLDEAKPKNNEIKTLKSLVNSIFKELKHKHLQFMQLQTFDTEGPKQGVFNFED